MFKIPLKTDNLTRFSWLGMVVTLGIVYGDLGTSPLYTMQAILHVADHVDEAFVLGALSCVFWTLTLQTTLKYVIIALQANNKGEGGVFSLFTLIRNRKNWTYVVAIIGACALLGDGVITPSITVTSAIEGLKIFIPDIPVVFFVIVILSVLFLSQQFGTSSLGRFFGPVMFFWFLMLSVLGFLQLVHLPEVLKAINPWYAYLLIVKHPHTLVLLGAVFLCTTGAEALYSDLGHCGMKNIRISWIYVKCSLLLSYFGQGAWVLTHLHEETNAVNPFFAIMPGWFLPFGVVLSTMAAIIASQALITGSFSIISEAISLNFFPKIRINYPGNVKGQMYIPLVNRMLYICCLFVVIYFQTSAAMESAYGLSITIAMLMTSVLLMFYLHNRIPIYLEILICGLFFIVETTFLVANLTKFFEGGWVSILLSSLFISIMYVWYKGAKIVRSYISYLDIKTYEPIISALSADTGVAKYATNLVYLTQSNDKSRVENQILYSILRNQPKRADVYWLLHIEMVDDPHVIEYDLSEIIPGNLIQVNMRLGFKVEPKVNLYFMQIVHDMVASQKMDVVSRYHSLQQYQVLSDFRFILIDEVQNSNFDFVFYKQMLMNYFFMIKRLIVNNIKSLGLDSTSAIVEEVPLLSSSNIFYKPNSGDVLKVTGTQLASSGQIVNRQPEEPVKSKEQPS